MEMHPEYAKAIGRLAYIWGWPMVNQHNRRIAITRAPQPSRLNGVLPAAPRGRLAMLSDYIDPTETFVTCPNQDVVYGLGFFSLDEEPAVLQVPDFGSRFWVYALYDGRIDQFAEIGKPYDTQPGFYLLVGPHWDGAVPEGITAVVRSPTEFADVIPRVFMDDTPEDRKEIQPYIAQISAYPLQEFDGNMKTVDWTKLPTLEGPASTGEETQWVVPERFFEQLEAVIDAVPPLPGEEAMYSNFRALLKVRTATRRRRRHSMRWRSTQKGMSSNLSSSGATMASPPVTVGIARSITPRQAMTGSTALVRRSRICSTTNRTRHSIFILTSMIAARNSTAMAPTRSRFSPDRSPPSMGSGH
jgi:hypothetical protein